MLTGVVMVWEPNGDRLSVDRELFSVADTAQIVAVSITTQESTHQLTRQGNRWQIDQQYPVEPSIAQVLLSLVHDVRVFRPVSQRESDSIRDLLSEEGIRVTISGPAGTMQDWLVGGSERTATSYFMPYGTEQPYLVHLPGYRSYLAGLFQMPANDWRERTIIDLTYTLLSEITWEYSNPGLENVSLQKTGAFFEVPGVAKLDTNRVVQVVQQLQFFQADYYINSGDFARFDSLITTPEVLKISVIPFERSQAQVLELWPLLPGDQYRLARMDQQWLLLEDRRVRMLFLQLQDFTARSRRSF